VISQQRKKARTVTVSHLKQCIGGEEKFDFLKDTVQNIPEPDSTPEKAKRKTSRGGARTRSKKKNEQVESSEDLTAESPEDEEIEESSQDNNDSCEEDCDQEEEEEETDFQEMDLTSHLKKSQATDTASRDLLSKKTKKTTTKHYSEIESTTVRIDELQSTISITKKFEICKSEDSDDYDEVSPESMSQISKEKPQTEVSTESPTNCPEVGLSNLNQETKAVQSCKIAFLIN